MPTPRTLLLAGIPVVVAFGVFAAVAPPIGGGPRRTAPGPPGAPVPTLAVEIGTVDVGSGKPFRVTVPASEEEIRLLRAGTLRVQSDAVDLAYAGSAPGSVTLTGTTRHVTPCVSFRTGVAVNVGGEEALHLDLGAKVRRAFTVRPIAGGRRYAIALTPGVRPPTVAARSTGLETAVIATGPNAAELVVTRTGAARLPGGTVRLRDPASKDTEIVRLPASSIPVRSFTSGSLLDAKGELPVRVNDRTIRDRPDVAVVLDPPGAYAIRWRGTEGGALALRLRPLTPTPLALRVGFRRKGRWLEVKEFEPDAP